jgi:hypothetical protein
VTEAGEELLLRRPRTEVARDRVEAAREHQTRTGLAGVRVVGVDHRPHPMDLAGEVAIVRARLGTRRYQRIPVAREWAGGRAYDPRSTSDREARRGIEGIGDDDRRGDCERAKLVLAAPGDGPCTWRTGRHVLCDQPAGEPAGTEHDDIEFARTHSIGNPCHGASGNIASSEAIVAASSVTSAAPASSST